MDKYLSIITNFGCHYQCPYCITKTNGLKVPVTTLGGLDKLDECINTVDPDYISISGGGDPLFEYEKHVNWYRELFRILLIHQKESYTLKNIRLEMHTSYLTDESTFPFYECDRVVYHLNHIEQLAHIKRTGVEKVRAVFVVTSKYSLEDLMEIAIYVQHSADIDELSFRQLVDEHYKEQHYLEKYLEAGHKKLWYYIKQNDYNTYYAENKIFTTFADLQTADLWKEVDANHGMKGERKKFFGIKKTNTNQPLRKNIYGLTDIKEQT